LIRRQFSLYQGSSQRFSFTVLLLSLIGRLVSSNGNQPVYYDALLTH